MTSPSEDRIIIARRPLSAQDLRKAHVLFPRMLQCDPNNPVTYLKYAGQLFKLKEYRKAKQKFKKFITIAPDRSNDYNDWLLNLYEEREFEEIIFFAEKYSNRFQFPDAAQFLMGLSFLHFGGYETAIKIFQEICKENSLSYHYWALALYLQGKEKEALKMFEKAKLIRVFPYSYFKREVLLLEEDLKEEGSKGFKDLIKKNIKAFEYFLAIRS